MFHTIRANPPATNLTSKGPLDCRHGTPATSPPSWPKGGRHGAARSICTVRQREQLVTFRCKPATLHTVCLDGAKRKDAVCPVSMLLARLSDLHESMLRANPPHRVTPL